MASVPKHIRYLAVIYTLCILTFGLFRLLLLLTNLEQINILPTDEKTALLLKSFLMGVRYDTVIIFYIFVIPFLLHSIFSFLNKDNAGVYKFSSIYFFILLLLCFLIFSIDIPFFNHFGERLTTAILAWTDSPGFMFGMIFSEPRFYGYLVPFVLSAVALFFLTRKTLNLVSTANSGKTGMIFKCVYFILFSFLLILGMRGRTSKKSPITEGTAFFSNYSLPNYLGLNPVFTFANSIKNDLNPDNNKLSLMNEKIALENAKTYLKIADTTYFDSPVARKITPDKKPLKANVVIVIMEGMSTFWMGDYGGPKGLTPVLDSLGKTSLIFKNIYTAGTHTHNGIYSTLFSFPALLKKHPMRIHFEFPHSGIASVLKDNGYKTLFFTTHDEQFDNTGGFLMKNGYDKIVSEKDYPKKKVLSTLGVPDHFMFNNSISILNQTSEELENFLAVYMTASNHSPMIIPEGIDFKAKSNDKKDQMIEYSDWAIGEFLRNASKQKWYSNTIFAFVADHGLNMGHTYDMPLSFHHSPFIIYAPELIESAKVYDCIGGQIDVSPTILGLLNITYVNNTLGIDLLRENRPYIFFSADEKIGCLDKTHFYIYRKIGIETLYEYKELSTQNYLNELKAKADSMKNYAFSMMQSAEWIIENKQAGKINGK